MRRISFSYLAVAIAVATRFLPHFPNFSPVLAALLFGGAHLKRRDAIWYPLALVTGSDILLTTVVYHLRLEWGQGITWLAFATVALLGYSLRGSETVTAIGVTSLAGPTSFFIISNFGVWLLGHVSRMYPQTWTGLVACYSAALPFYRNSLLATVVYAAVLFGANEVYGRRNHGVVAAVHGN